MNFNIEAPENIKKKQYVWLRPYSNIGKLKAELPKPKLTVKYVGKINDQFCVGTKKYFSSSVYNTKSHLKLKADESVNLQLLRPISGCITKKSYLAGK